jgi:hypothetical protein
MDTLENPSSLANDMQRILFEMKWLLPWGAIASYNATGGGGVPSSQPPAGVRLEGQSEELPHVYWLRRWNETFGLERKEAIYQAARKELDSWRKRPKVKVKEETREDFERRLIEKGAGWTVDDVARSFKCLPKEVLRVRIKHGVTPDLGKTQAATVEKLTRSDRAERARQMRSERMPLRSIALALSCDVATVHRDLAEAA